CSLEAATGCVSDRTRKGTWPRLGDGHSQSRKGAAGHAPAALASAPGRTRARVCVLPGRWPEARRSPDARSVARRGRAFYLGGQDLERIAAATARDGLATRPPGRVSRLRIRGLCQ